MEPEKLTPFEKNKLNSRHLRGTIAETLKSTVSHFTSDEGALLKFHGTYQQDDRDKRQELLKDKKEPAYSMMVRSKIPGGVLTAAQYLAHDELSDRYGNKTLRITTRQGFQFHGVLKKNLKTVIRGVNAKLITTSGACGDVVRNVMAFPAPSFEPWQPEVHRYARILSEQFLSRSGSYHEIWLNGEKVELPGTSGAEPIYGAAYLPRKFKIGMSGPTDNTVDVYTHDIGIIPEVEENRLTGFNILVGGGFGTTHGVKTTYPRLATPFCFVPPEDLAGISKAIVLVQRDYGNRADRKNARLKYLLDARGLDWFRAEVEKRFGKKTLPVRAIKIKTIDFYHGWRRENKGTWCFGLFVENGRIKDQGTMKLKTALREICRKFGPTLYLTPAQDILLAGLAETQKKPLEDLLRNYGVRLPEELSEIRKNSMACPALPTCGLAISESERVLPAIMDDLEKVLAMTGLTGMPIIVRMTGCPNGCARPYNAEIAFVGKTVRSYNIYVGGSRRGDRMVYLLAEKIDQAHIAATLKPLLEEYRKSRHSEESFGDFCDRLGAEKARALAGATITEKETWAVTPTLPPSAILGGPACRQAGE